MNRRTFLRQILPAANNKPIPETTTSLAIWQPSKDNPWDSSAANYLYNRMGFGANYTELGAAVAMSPHDIIKNLLDDSLLGSAKIPPPPDYSDQWLTVQPYTGTDDNQYHAQYDRYQNAKLDLQGSWMQLMTSPDAQFREKLAFFWSNHFVIGSEKMYYPHIIYKYIDYLRRNAWGNFKQIVKDITIDPAMLVYLDGIWNISSNINENYAREVMELFTMGRVDVNGNANYTQDDIRAVARALNGWRYHTDVLTPEIMPPYFANYYFDFTTKTTPFGAAAKVYGLDTASKYALFGVDLEKIEADIIELMFQMRSSQIAHHIVEKIYAYFVYADTMGTAAQTVISELADTFIQSNWDMKTVLLQLFQSEHFFDLTHRASSIKSPVEFTLAALRKLNIAVNTFQCCTLRLICSDMDQNILQPPNVKGWAGYRTWVNSTTLPKRNYDIIRNLVINGWIDGRGINPHNGQVFDGIAWQDSDVLKWASQFPDYQADYLSFVTELAVFLLPLEIGTDVITQIATDNGPAHFYEWGSLPSDQTAGIVRKLVFAITQLAEFELQ